MIEDLEFSNPSHDCWDSRILVDPMFTNPVGIEVQMVAVDNLITTKAIFGDCGILQDGDQSTKVAKESSTSRLWMIIFVLVVKVENFNQLTMGPKDLLQHTKILPVLIDYEGCITLHKLCGTNIIREVPLVIIQLLWVNLMDDLLRHQGRCH